MNTPVVVDEAQGAVPVRARRVEFGVKPLVGRGAP